MWVSSIVLTAGLEIASFVTWYSWAYIGSTLTVSFTLSCTSADYKLLGPLLVCVNLSLAVSLNVLIKEPVTQNPLKLVYKVIKYAVKNKHPRQRSAFTYHEDHLPSRIDFGKTKYGGPFTTEQVEDVKTLYRTSLVILIESALFGVTNEEHSIYSNLRGLFTNTDSCLPNCASSKL